MINLLPPRYKEEIRKEANWRMFLILGLLAFLFLLSFFFIIFFVKMYISGQAEIQDIYLQDEREEFERGGMQELEEEIKIINRELFQINSFYQEQPKPSDFLQSLKRNLPPGSYLTSLSFKYLSPEEGIEVTLGGFTPSREALRRLKENLEENMEVYEMNFTEDINYRNPDNFSFSFKANL